MEQIYLIKDPNCYVIGWVMGIGEAEDYVKAHPGTWYDPCSRIKI